MLFSKSFSNLEGLRSYLNRTPTNKLFAGRDLSSHETGRHAKEFRKTESYEEADGLLRDGDTENARKLAAAAIAGRNMAHGDGERVRRYSSVCGGAANVPAMLMGLPKSMIAQKRIKYKDSKVISFIYNLSISCDVCADEINAVSAALVSAVMGLEKKGYRVNLYTVCAGRCGEDEKIAMFVRIKDSGQYMDVKKMAYPLVNPSMLRRHYFRFAETVPGLKSSSWTWGYGAPLTKADEIAAAATEAGVHARKIVSFYDIRQMSPSQIADFILS